MFLISNGMGKILFVANWKMEPATAQEAVSLWGATKRAAAKTSKTSTVVCPPFIHLSSCAKTQRGTVLLGAQDVSLFSDGAHTGEISPSMLKEARVRYVIIGHSERRALGETDAIIARKAKVALAHGLRPIVCVGEKERGHHGEHLGLLQEQITKSLAGTNRATAKGLVIAYEPLWAIGKSYKYAMRPGEIHEMSIFIRKILVKLFGRTAGIGIPILYGGSVEKENIADVVFGGEVDGVLVGHASLNGQQVHGMLKALEGKYHRHAQNTF